ncbi:unnamed protein product [Caenorhabditis nigoni]
MIFWLPIHLGDLAGTCHVPEPEMIDLSRQMLAVLLDEWPIAMGMRLEDQDLLAILLHKNPVTTVGILSFYRAQTGFVPRTIDASEGQEFHTVVICTTRTTPFHSVAKTQSTQNGTQEPDFIEDHRRLNVALFRTKQLCVILVDLKAARSSDKWSQLVAEVPARAIHKAQVFVDQLHRKRLLHRNLGEAKYAKNLLNGGIDPENIALMATYIGQCDLLKKLMDEHIEATGNGIWHNRHYKLSLL